MCFVPQRRAIFSSLIWPAGFAPAALASLLFDPSGATNHGKTQCFRDFATFSRTWIFFLLRLSLFWSSFFFSSLLFFDSYHLCFSSVHIVGSLTSKLPSIMLNNQRVTIVNSLNIYRKKYIYILYQSVSHVAHSYVTKNVSTSNIIADPPCIAR